ncbi:uncharacterized protein FRV6_16968 [Fusarium oxysporum]|uniref:Uncharacterized protein n=1 Tax=Fusarium oxysporum TaxID=5507 RepID=A0A2H3U7I9_FUSOX|nr:uncharacterized protein FRV6_16968 [Fusarium oxysporum]
MPSHRGSVFSTAQAKGLNKFPLPPA